MIASIVTMIIGIISIIATGKHNLIPKRGENDGNGSLLNKTAVIIISGGQRPPYKG
ncbi:MAG TPA: hypothetical protein GXZ27_07900 [Thermoanaerobacterales bacterium]|jgi:uncharacterized SAM-binding protein YcdF (DUF218 family)|nr:hypothetical protein [Thermoanaerobacterales bacterium]